MTPPDPTTDRNEARQLSPQDVLAMEQVVMGGWREDETHDNNQTASMAARRERLLRLLSPLREVQVQSTLASESDGPPDSGAASLADRAFEAVLKLRAEEETGAGRQSLHGDEPVLSELDVEALDSLMLEELHVKRVPSSLRERASKVHALFALAAGASAAGASAAGAEAGEDGNVSIAAATAARAQSQRLTEATMQRVMSVRATSPIVMPEPVRRGRVPLREIASVAAVLMIGGATLWPMAAAASSARARTVCESNMASLAGAFTRYGADFRGALPQASDPASRSKDSTWWNVGENPSQSNSANLFTIHRASYAPLSNTSCPGNEHGCKTMNPQRADWVQADWDNLDQVSYSYFVMFGNTQPNWEQGYQGSNTTVVLADRSPVIRRAIAGQPVSVGENSSNHGGSGQRVLRVDGSSDWFVSPYDAGPGKNAGTNAAGNRYSQTGRTTGARAQRLGTADNIWLPVSLEETLLAIRTQQEQGIAQGVVSVPSPEQAARARSIRLQGTETPGSARDAFLGP